MIMIVSSKILLPLQIDPLHGTLAYEGKINTRVVIALLLYVCLLGCSGHSTLQALTAAAAA
jgi:hypothetical protein